MRKTTSALLMILASAFGMEAMAQTVNGQIGGYDYVDLGLKSGKLWATYNVGATKPTEYGYYFAWGETTPKSEYGWDNYDLCYGRYTYLKKYYADDQLTVLESADDAATVNWGSAWRMPTTSEQSELVYGCTWEWTDDFNGSGIAGRIGTSESNGNTIFLPAAGRVMNRIDNRGYNGYYWSSSVRKNDFTDGCCIYFLDYLFQTDYSSRYWGQNVRAITTGDASANLIKNQELTCCINGGILTISNAQPNINIQIFDINSKLIKTAETDNNGNADIPFSETKGIYVVTVGNQSIKVACTE